MKLSFTTKEIGAQPMLAIRATSAMDKLEGLMGSLFGEVYGYIQESGEQPTGMPFSRYHSMDGATVDLECGMPVASPMDGKGRVEAGELPAGTVATVTHLGPLQQSPAVVVRADGVDGFAGTRTGGGALGRSMSPILARNPTNRNGARTSFFPCAEPHPAQTARFRRARKTGRA